MYEDLKEKDITVIEYIKEHCGTKGYPPSVREICKKANIKSTSTVFEVLKKLEKLNYIRKDPTKPRAIEILNKSLKNDDVVGIYTEILNLPLLGQIAAGEPILAEQNIDEYIPLPASYIRGKNCFLLKVKGDSMIEAGIFEKDYIIVDASQNTPNQGKIVAAVIDGNEATVKRFYKKDGKIILRPENAIYSDMVFEVNRVQILGTVTGLFRTI